MQETWVWSLVGKTSWRRERLPTPVFWSGEFHGLYSSWSRKESDTTERLSVYQNVQKKDGEKPRDFILTSALKRKKHKCIKSLSIYSWHSVWFCIYAQVRCLLLLLLSRFSRVRLCDPIDGSPSGSSDPGILQARTLEWVAISFSNACMHAKSLHSCLTLCDPMDSSPPGSSIHRILPARTLEWVAISLSNACMHAKSLHSCPTLCDPMDSSPPGSSIHRILQARTLEWAAMSFSKVCCLEYSKPSV